MDLFQDSHPVIPGFDVLFLLFQGFFWALIQARLAQFSRKPQSPRTAVNMNRQILAQIAFPIFFNSFGFSFTAYFTTKVDYHPGLERFISKKAVLG